MTIVLFARADDFATRLSFHLDAREIPRRVELNEHKFREYQLAATLSPRDRSLSPMIGKRGSAVRARDPAGDIQLEFKACAVPTCAPGSFSDSR